MPPTTPPPQHYAVYAARVRRAFLLRAHPDRFRSYGPTVQRQQEQLIQALSARFADDDFLAYQASSSPSGAGGPSGNGMMFAGSGMNSGRSSLLSSSIGTAVIMPFSLEASSNSLIHHKLNLEQSPHAILKAMVGSLQATGLATNHLPKEPHEPSFDLSSQEVLQQSSRTNIHWSPPSPSYPGTTVSDRFNVHSRQGRDLKAFLFSAKDDGFDPLEVQQRRAHRLDVAALALVVRQRYGFAAVDGTDLGWSSENMAKLLRSLVDLHEEHKTALHLNSFYPLRLVWSSEVFVDYVDALDLYGGVLYLNPACTSIQLLEALQAVTAERMEQYTQNRERLQRNLETVSRHLGGIAGVRLVKGHSCTSADYHEWVEKLANDFTLDSKEDQRRTSTGTTTALALERVTIKVEGATRRVKVNAEEGSIQIGTSMTTDVIVRGIQSNITKARQTMQKQRQYQQEVYRSTIDRVKHELGLQQVRKHRPVSMNQVVHALERLTQEVVGTKLAGNSLCVAVRGQFCSLDDDGAVLIPWDWQ